MANCQDLDEKRETALMCDPYIGRQDSDNLGKLEGKLVKGNKAQKHIKEPLTCSFVP